MGTMGHCEFHDLCAQEIMPDTLLLWDSSFTTFNMGVVEEKISQMCFAVPEARGSSAQQHQSTNGDQTCILFSSGPEFLFDQSRVALGKHYPAIRQPQQMRQV